MEFIRIRLGLTGTKRSCESQVCGACTVLVEDQPVSSCNYLAFEAHNKSVLTIEGLAKGEELDPLQEAFMRNVGAQCGFCTPGQIMSAKALLLQNPSPTREQIVEWLSGNICRCGAYPAIITSDSRSGCRIWQREIQKADTANFWTGSRRLGQAGLQMPRQCS